MTEKEGVYKMMGSCLLGSKTEETILGVSEQKKEPKEAMNHAFIKNILILSILSNNVLRHE